MKIFTFENFIQGHCNEEALDAARGAARGDFSGPGFSGQNLILFLGGTGTGKTHLLRACEHYAAMGHSASEIYYATADDFTAELLDELYREGSVHSFCRRCESRNLFLLDDVHHLAGKEATQELLAGILERLWGAGKTAVLTADSFPRFLQRLDVRVIPLETPECSVRKEILRRKAEELGLADADEVAAYLAEHADVDVRTLEGLMARTAAYAELLDVRPDRELAEHMLQMLKPEE